MRYPDLQLNIMRHCDDIVRSAREIQLEYDVEVIHKRGKLLNVTDDQIRSLINGLRYPQND